MGEDRPRVRPERVTDTYAFAVWRRLVFWVVDGHTPLEELERLRVLSASMNAKRRGEKNVALVVIHESRSTMSAEERRSVAKLLDETKHTREASATVVMAGGILGALHRSVLTGLSLVVPPPHPTRICADVATAVTFLHPHIEALSGPIAPEHVEGMARDLHGEVCARKLEAGAASG